MKRVLFLLTLFTLYNCTTSNETGPDSGVSSNPNFLNGTIKTTEDRAVVAALVRFANEIDTTEDITDSNGVYEVELIENSSYAVSVSINGSIIYSEKDFIANNDTKEDIIIEDSLVFQSKTETDTIFTLPLGAIILNSTNSRIDDTQIITGQNATFQIYPAAANNNYGQEQYFSIGTYDEKTVSRALLKFELDTFKTDEPVDSAIIELTIDSIFKDTIPKEITLLVYPILKSWNEGKGKNSVNDSSSNGATSLERYFGEKWDSIGVGINGIDAENEALSFSFPKIVKGDIIKLNISPIMNRWLSKDLENKGILIINKDEGTPTYYNFPRFHSSESANIDASPKLKVAY